MKKKFNYCNQEMKYEGCPGCAYAKHKFKLPCGMVYESERFNLSQDWEIPIPGFMILSPIRHIENFCELTFKERNEAFKIVNKTITLLRSNHVCDRFDVVFEEKENRHFHIWILPRHDWMKNITDNITENIGIIFNYAKANFRTENVYQEINEISDILRKQF